MSVRVAWLHPLVLVPLGLTVWVYHPITRVFFFADDFVHFTEIVNEGPLVFLLKPFGGQAFLARNLVYLGLYRVFGVDPVRLQWIVLLTHLVNVGIAFAVLRAFTASAWLGCLGATVFGTSPLAAGTLGWYAAFGHVLVGTMLWLVLGSVACTAAGERVPVRTVACWGALLLVGSTFYGPGMGAACAFPLAALVLLPAARRQPRVIVALLALPAATIGVYLGLRHLYTFIGGRLPLEEILQQQLALSGFETIPPLFVQLLGYSAAGTLLGFFLSAYPAPAAWGAVVAFAGGLALVLWRGAGHTRRTALAMLLLWLGTYLVIAAGRAHIYSLFKIAPSVAATMGRYHYAGLIPVVVVLCTILQVLVGARRVAQGTVVALLLGLWVHGYRAGSFHIDERPLCHDWFLSTRQEIATLAAKAPPGPVYIENGTTPPYVLGPAIPDRYFPGRAGVFLLSHPTGRLDGRELRFVERDPEVLDWHAQTPGTPLARLLVAPADIPAP